MRISPETYNVYLNEVLGEEYQFSAELAKTFSTISGKSDLLEVAAILVTLGNNSGDTNVSEQLNDLLMMAKLTYSDEISEFKANVNKEINQLYQAEIEEERLRVEYRKAKAFEEKERLRMSRIYDDVLEELDRVTNPRIGDNAIDNQRWYGNVSRRDKMLILIDKINHGTCTELSIEERELASVFKDKFGLKLELRGWLVKTYAFVDRKAADEIRETIVRSK